MVNITNNALLSCVELFIELNEELACKLIYNVL